MGFTASAHHIEPIVCEIRFLTYYYDNATVILVRINTKADV
jgi:hypothetical protein